MANYRTRRLAEDRPNEVTGADETPVAREADAPNNPSAAPASAAPADNPVEQAAQAALKLRLSELEAAEHWRQEQRPRPPPPEQQEAVAQAQREVQQWLAERPGIVGHPGAHEASRRLIVDGYMLASPAWRRAMEERGFAPGDYSTPPQRSSVPLAAKPQAAVEEAPDRHVHISAPVSRGAPSYTGKQIVSAEQAARNLTPQQLEAARLSGITAEEYARNLMRMLRLKESGALQQ